MFDVIMPKMGESITEGTILEWKKKIGDIVSKDEVLLEISTDKVDSEIPSPAEGTILEIMAQVNDVIPVGEIIARIGNVDEILENSLEKEIPASLAESESNMESEKQKTESKLSNIVQVDDTILSPKRFYSPLVKSIAKKEGISQAELDSNAAYLFKFTKQ